MTQLDDLYNELDEKEALVARYDAEMRELQPPIKAYLNDRASLRPAKEPVKQMRRLEELRDLRAGVRGMDELRRRIHEFENTTRLKLAMISVLDADIAKLEALDCGSNERMEIRRKEELTIATGRRNSYAASLEVLGLPRDLAVEVA